MNNPLSTQAMNNPLFNPTIPPMIIYKKPTQQYHHFINRYCQSKSKMIKCSSKEDALIKANQFWEQHKSNSEFINNYVSSTLTYPVQEDKSQKNITSFFSKKEKSQLEPMEEVSGLLVNSLPDLNSPLNPKIRKQDELSEPKIMDHGSSKKFKKASNFYDLEKIIDYFFKDDLSITVDIKEELIKDMKVDINIHENMYISLTKYIELKEQYTQLSEFIKKKNETYENFQKLDNSLNTYANLLIKCRNTKTLLREWIEQRSLSDLRNRDSLKTFEDELQAMKGELCLAMINISSLLSIILPILSKRVSNAIYYKKVNLVPAVYESPMQFLCFNIDSDWYFAQKLLNLIISEEGNVYPMDFTNCKDVIDLFKDESIILVKLDKLFEFLFADDKTSGKQRSSKVQALNTILLKIFPLMSFTCNNEVYIMDIVKLVQKNENMIDILVDLLENPDIDNSIEGILCTIPIHTFRFTRKKKCTEARATKQLSLTIPPQRDR